MSNLEISPPVITAETLRALAALNGVDLSSERAASLVPQAEAHFGLMGALDALDPRGAEIAPEFRLDGETTPR